MKEEIKEMMVDFLNEGHEIDLDAFTEEYYNSEFNFNNADPTSGQRCWTEFEVADMVSEAYEEVTR